MSSSKKNRSLSPQSQKIPHVRAFTLIEIMVVMAIIAVLVAVSIASITTIRLRGRNAQRSTDISTIINGVYQYALDNNNTVPATITTTQTDICRTGAASCSGLIDLSVLTNSQKYLVTMPTDPLSSSTNDSGYAILKTATGRVTVLAPLAEGGTSISITR